MIIQKFILIRNISSFYYVENSLIFFWIIYIFSLNGSYEEQHAFETFFTNKRLLFNSQFILIFCNTFPFRISVLVDVLSNALMVSLAAMLSSISTIV